ncbi:hypothetical protein Tco_1182228 [Tanacetum coccineum]
MMDDSETKMEVKTPYELLKYDQKKQLGKNNKAKMTLYNGLPRKDEETTDIGFTRFNAIVTSLKSLDQDYSSKNLVRKFLRTLPLKWRAKVTVFEEAKDLATLPLDELIGNLKVYKIILENDGVTSKTTKEKVKPLSLKAKVNREQTSDDSDSQGGSERSVAIDSVAGLKNSKEVAVIVSGRKEVEAQEKSEVVTIARKKVTSLVNVRSPRRKRHLSEEHIVELQKENEELLRFNKDFTKTFEKLLKEKRSLESKKSKFLSKINDLEFEVKKLANDKEVVEPYEKYDILTQDVDSLKCEFSSEFSGDLTQAIGELGLIISGEFEPNIRRVNIILGKFSDKLTQALAQAEGETDAQEGQVMEETYENTSDRVHAMLDAKAEAVHIILNGIGNDIYSTVEACANAKEMWLAIECLVQGESINKQDVMTKLFWEFGKFVSRDGESLESYYTRLYKMMNEIVRNKLKVDTVDPVMSRSLTP